MKVSSGLFSGVLTLGLGLVGLDVVHSSWPLSAEKGEQDVRQIVNNARRLEGRLARYREVGPMRKEARNRVIAALLAGDLTLFEAAAWFRFLNENPPECPADPICWPGKSAEEKLCRQVIGHVEDEEGDQSRRTRGAECRRLEKELEEHLAQHGKVILPEL
jgi:hypothetical protein